MQENDPKHLLSNHAVIQRGKSGRQNMEMFAFTSAVCGYHVYQDLLSHQLEKKLVAKREFNNTMDKHAVKVVKGNENVGHLPREFSRILWYFLARSGEISVEVIGCR